MPDLLSTTGAAQAPDALTEAPAPAPVRQRDPVAVELGRRGGLKGGKARAAQLSPEQRKAIAAKAAAARWGTKRTTAAAPQASGGSPATMTSQSAALEQPSRAPLGQPSVQPQASPPGSAPAASGAPAPQVAPAGVTPPRPEASGIKVEIAPGVTVPVRGGSAVDWPAADLGVRPAAAAPAADSPAIGTAPSAPIEGVPPSASPAPAASSRPPAPTDPVASGVSEPPANLEQQAPRASATPAAPATPAARPAPETMREVMERLDGLPGVDSPPQLRLIDWRRRVADLYSEVRRLSQSDPEAGWALWCSVREALYRRHPLSPVPADRRTAFVARYFAYNPGLRFELPVRPDAARPQTVGAAVTSVSLPSSGPEPMAFERIGRVEVPLGGGLYRLSVFWIPGYAGGLFLPFRDGTNGAETYGAGRYLLDTAKGADLGAGRDGGMLVVDFNFAFQPSCAFDARWACPLSPPENRFDVPIRAGERLS